jgi:glycerol-3-phosphate acyltransferase PlsX
MRIGLDAMGGDIGPQATVLGAVESLKHIASDVVLFGDQMQIEAVLTGLTYDKGRIHIVHTDEVIGNEEAPVKAIRSKKNSSMVLGLQGLIDHTLDAFISAGNTGALLAGGTLKVGRLTGIDRPALTIPYPMDTGIGVLVDAGANTECSPKNLQQFAIMGHLYARFVFQMEKPLTGLVNIGTEEKKGNTLYQESHQLLKKTPIIEFYGNLEARDIPAGVCDVIVCDGFTGNIILKLSEGIAKSFSKNLKASLLKNVFTKLAALVIKPGLEAFKKKLDYTEYGGAPLLGVKAPVVKAHGSSNAKAFMNAIRYAERYAASGVIAKIEQSMTELGDDAEQKKEDNQ